MSRELKQVLREAGTTQKAWAALNELKESSVSRMCKRGCIVVDGRVYSPTKYVVVSLTSGDKCSK